MNPSWQPTRDRSETTAEPKNTLAWQIRLATRAIVFTPLVVLLGVLGNMLGYLLALTGLVIVPESPWHYAARELYIYHGRAILQLEPGFLEYDEHLLYRPRNGTFAFNNYEFKTTIGSSDGHRNNPFLKEPPEVVIIGDSFAQGWGVNDGETVASVLTRDHDRKTLTYGVSSYNTARALHLLRRALANPAKPRPHHLVIFYCTNDYVENVYYLTHGMKTYTPAEFTAQVNRARQHTAQTSLLTLPLAHHAASLRNGYLKWDRMMKARRDYGNLYDPDPDVSYAEQARVFKEVLNANLDLIRDFNIIVVAFKGWGGKDDFGPALASNPRLADNRQISVIINTVPSSGYFSLDGHLNERGSRAVAKLIAERISQSAKQSEATNSQ